MLKKDQLISLAKAVAKADKNSPTAYSFDGEQFSYEALNETLRAELNEYAGTYSLYRENKNLIFSIIEETMDDILPKKIEESYGLFAEVKTFKQGDRPMFRRKISARNRAKQFITRVGLAGIYEVFKLGGQESFEVQTSAVGGAAQIGLEEFLDGMVDFAEVTAIVMEGIDELIYQEAAKALQSAINQLPTANVRTVAGFDEEHFDQLINIASAYGEPTIYCTNEFAVKLVPAEGWRYTDAMKEELWRTGRLASYKGHRVVILPQAFVDETNSKKLVDPSYCWIIPSGGDTKPVKIAFEGQTIVDEYQNKDRSREIQVYKKVGVVALMTNNICSYKDTSLEGMDTWTLNNKNIKNNVYVANAKDFKEEPQG
jgi:hypothetical protein